MSSLIQKLLDAYSPTERPNIGHFESPNSYVLPPLSKDTSTTPEGRDFLLNSLVRPLDKRKRM